MSLQDFEYLLMRRINSLSEKELEEYISTLKLRNYRGCKLVPPILTSNTYPIIQNMRLNDWIINMCENRLKEM